MNDLGSPLKSSGLCGNAITKENLLLIMPPALTRGKSILALAEADAEVLEARLAEIDRVRTISNIDGLDEAVLDILAHDFKVDWWDADYSLEEKRRILKDSWRVHKLLGTRAAVEIALRAIYPKAEVQEWFEYGGKPYHFKLNIDLTGETSDADRPWRVLERVNFYKSLRSHMEEIVFNTILPPAVLHTGGPVGAMPLVSVPGAADRPDFQQSLPVGGVFGSKQKFFVPEDTAPPPSTTILRTGGVCTILSNLSKGE